MQKRYIVLASMLVLAFMPACSPLTLEQVKYGWPVESVVTVNSMNWAEEGRYVVSFPAGPLAMSEFQDSSALIGASLRVIRNADGFYFITGPRFKSVYVFTPGAGTLKLFNALEVSRTGLNAPALNLRPPYVELLDGSAPARYLTKDDATEGSRPQ